MKEKFNSDVRIYKDGHIVGVPSGNVRVIVKVFEEDVEMVNLFNANHILVGASSGEGFGLPALQALASGMPTICTEECVSYGRFLGGLGLKSSYVDSPWPSMHPGK